MNKPLENNDEILRETLSNMDMAMASINECIVCIDDEGYIQWCNDKFCKLIEKLRIEVLGKNVNSLVQLYTESHTKAENFFNICLRIVKTKITEIYKFLQHPHDGVFLNVYATLAYNNHKGNHFTIVLRDVTLEHDYLEQIADSRHTLKNLTYYLDSIIKHISNMVIILTPDLRIKKINSSAVKTLKYAGSELVGQTIDKIFSKAKSDDPAGNSNLRNNADILEILTGSKSILNREFSFVTSDNIDIPVIFSATTLGNVSNDIVCIAQDITELKKAHQQITYLATHDTLTAVSNRSAFNDMIEREIARSRRHGLKMALLFIDLDNFKNINDSLGHEAGDEVLKHVAEVLQKNIRIEDTLARYHKHDNFVGRLGGDEFVIILTEIKEDADINAFATRIFKNFEQPLTISNETIYIGLSMGIAKFPEHGDSSGEIIKNADTAMYYAKKSGRNNYRIYTAEHSASYKKQLEIENCLHKALKEQHFYLEYQPQYSTVTGKLHGIEALIRLNSPDLGKLSPDQFIQIAEKTRLIRDIGRWVLIEASRQMISWQTAGIINDDVYIAVNVSPFQLVDGEFVETINYLVNEIGIKPKHLNLEITESTLMNKLAGSENVLHDLKDIGINISIDDFGTGYSSLSKITELPINALKIDKEFIKHVPDHKSNTLIINSIIKLANELGLRVVAEGVETKAQADFLIHAGCDYLQGYYISKAISADKLAEILKKNS